MIFKYLLADIGKPVPIVYKKLELFEDDVAKDSVSDYNYSVNCFGCEHSFHNMMSFYFN